LNAEHYVVGVGIFAAEVMGVIGGDEGDREFALEAEEGFVDFLFVFEALVLDFEIEIAFAEDVFVLLGYGFGFLVAACDQFFAEFSAEAAGEADKAGGVLSEIALADAGLAIEAVERRFRGNANEVAVTFFVLGEDEEVVVFVAFAGGAVVLVLADIEFAAEDGLDAFVLGGFKEVDCAVDVAVVGHGDGFLAEGGDAVDELGDVAGAVEEGVFGVEMEVGELGHG
jgi:hypothetical protein